MKTIWNNSVKLASLLLFIILLFLILISIINFVYISFYSHKFLVTESYIKSDYIENNNSFHSISVTTNITISGLRDLLEGRGKVYYKLALLGDANNFIYDDYDKNDQLIIEFLDKNGFKIYELELYFYSIVNLIDYNNQITGFSNKDNFYMKLNDYKRFSKIHYISNYNIKKMIK